MGLWGVLAAQGGGGSLWWEQEPRRADGQDTLWRASTREALDIPGGVPCRGAVTATPGRPAPGRAAPASERRRRRRAVAGLREVSPPGRGPEASSARGWGPPASGPCSCPRWQAGHTADGGEGRAPAPAAAQGGLTVGGPRAAGSHAAGPAGETAGGRRRPRASSGAAAGPAGRPASGPGQQPSGRECPPAGAGRSPPSLRCLVVRPGCQGDGEAQRGPGPGRRRWSWGAACRRAVKHVRRHNRRRPRPGRKKRCGHGPQAVPAHARPPAGPSQWIWGGGGQGWPQVGSTPSTPRSAPQCVGARAPVWRGAATVCTSKVSTTRAFCRSSSAPGPVGGSATPLGQSKSGARE